MAVDVQLVIKESKNLAVAAKQVWQRLNGVSPTREEELTALQKESAALLSLRAEATKLRSGIRLVQRQKELKASYLIRRDAAQAPVPRSRRGSLDATRALALAHTRRMLEGHPLHARRGLAHAPHSARAACCTRLRLLSGSDGEDLLEVTCGYMRLHVVTCGDVPQVGRGGPSRRDATGRRVHRQAAEGALPQGGAAVVTYVTHVTALPQGGAAVVAA